MTQSLTTRVNRLDKYITEGRLIRNDWIGKDKGRATACLLVALAPECGKARSADACPASVMPRWFAELTPWMDDRGTDEAWPSMVRRYAAVARRWHAIDADAWQRCEWLVKIACIEEALR